MLKNKKVKWLILVGVLAALVVALFPVGCATPAPAVDTSEMEREIAKLKGEVSRLEKEAAGMVPAPPPTPELPEVINLAGGP